MNSHNIESAEFLRIFHSGQPVVIKFQQVSPLDMDYVRKVTETLLEEKIDSFLCLCAHCDKGVLTKWRQSYTKRIFFKNNGLDIDKNHKQAIEQFKESMSNGDIHTHLLMEGMEFLVELSFQEINKNSILIVVRNHGEMNASEIKNVNFMIDRGRKTNEVSTCYLMRHPTKRVED